ncbi:hypothetical protein Nepgr_012734 [Nepenthes gracilis]|uniref:Uncharacterized protein n=1 Tax=Nepenthes gracilis TaxID=150966 RepID=A0AAD3SGN5_NEPGR|nr:hypothetical protein Nepgr_012734 [Nepenthes gracilis]
MKFSSLINEQCAQVLPIPRDVNLVGSRWSQQLDFRVNWCQTSGVRGGMGSIFLLVVMLMLLANLEKLVLVLAVSGVLIDVKLTSHYLGNDCF